MGQKENEHEAQARERERAQKRLAPLGRLLGDSLSELNVLRVLPELATHLRAIRRATEGMNAEVRGMHAAVRRVEVQVKELQGQLDAIEGRVVEVEDGMSRLEPHIADVNLAMRPLRRARARLPQRPPAGTRPGDSPAEPEPVPLPPQAGP